MQLNMGMPGTVALLISLLTAGALALHLVHGGSAVASGWSLARLHLSSRHDAAAQWRQRQHDPACSDGVNITQLLCHSMSARPATHDGNSSTAGSTTGNATGLPASWAAGHIAHDFRHWRSSGIQKEALDQLVSNVDGFHWGEPINSFRFQIISGQLYMEPIGPDYHRDDSGQILWFPAPTTAPGNMSISGRAPLAMLALKELLLLYPGQVPDVDAFMHFGDMPVVLLGEAPAPAPLFSPCSSEDYAEIPWPDWSFWSGKGWGTKRAELLRSNAAVPLAKRKPALMYRGRATADTDNKRKAVVGCPHQLPAAKKQLIDAESVTWLQTKHRVSMADMCKWRYQIYIEAAGWSASLKYRLACGSALLQVKPRWAEWFSRGLRPGKHYLEVPAEPLEAICPAVVQTLEAAEVGLAGNARNGKGSGNTGDHGGGGDSSNSTLIVDPVAVATAGTAFVLQRLRMQDVRDYMLDLLRTYASLQRFTPEPSAGAEFLTAERLLRHFVHDTDRERVLAANPWLRCALDQGI